MVQPLDLRSRAQGRGGDRHEGLVSFLGTARPSGTRASRTQEPSAAVLLERAEPRFTSGIRFRLCRVWGMSRSGEPISSMRPLDARIGP